MSGRPRRQKKAFEPPKDPSVFYVEKIMDRKVAPDGTALYFVKWVDYSPSQNTWEPLSNLTGCDDELAEFENSLREKNEKAQEEPQQDEEDDDKKAEEPEDKKPEIFIHQEIPEGKEPERIKCIVSGHATRLFLVKWRTVEGTADDSFDNCALVDMEMFKYAYPQLVIGFYEKHITWKN